MLCLNENEERTEARVPKLLIGRSTIIVIEGHSTCKELKKKLFEFHSAFEILQFIMHRNDLSQGLLLLNVLILFYKFKTQKHEHDKNHLRSIE